MSNDWYMLIFAVTTLAFFILLQAEEWKHRAELMRVNRVCREEINDILETARAERQELLDRIMANNIQEFKSATGQMPVKRSEHGNYLVDAMQKSLKNHYVKE